MIRLPMFVVIAIIAITYFLSHQIAMQYDINIAILFVSLSLFEYIVYMFFIKQYKKANDRVYYFAAWEMGSYANFYAQSEGNSWTKSIYVKSVLKDKGGYLFIDRFRFDQSVKRFFKFFSLRKRFENFNCYIDPKELVKSGIVFGKMGSGKTEFYNTLIEQDAFDRYVINDIKGDFVQKFYNKRKDIILNPYDQRGKIWDFFEEAKESSFVVEIFLTNLFNSLAGDKKDFFSASAKERYMRLFNEINFKHSEKSSKEKMDLFVRELKKYFIEVKKSGRTSEADVASTMKITFEFFDYLNFCMKNDIETFTIKEFLRKKNCKLFLLNRDDQKSKLTPFYTGFLAAFTAVMLSQPDNKENLTLFVLDEYLSFAKNLDDETLEGLHTRMRSKGGCLLPGVQFFPGYREENITQKMLNSASFWFLFEGIDQYTLDRLNKAAGKVKYQRENVDLVKKRKDLANTTFQTQEADLLNPTIFQNLSENYEHITFMPSSKIMYKGYTPRIEFKNANEQFIQSDNIGAFYRRKG